MSRRTSLPEITGFLAEQLAISADRLSPDSDLCRDFRIEGDDCLSLMTAFAERFDVDMSGYRWERHHGAEGFDAGAVLFEALFRRTGGAPLMPLSPRLLLECANTGCWLIDYPPYQEPDSGIVRQFGRSVVSSLILLSLIAAIGFIAAILWR